MCGINSYAPKYHAIPICGTKRGIDSAFTRCRLRPEAALLFRTEFDLRRPFNITVLSFYIVLPFGLSGSPGDSEK